MRPRLRSVLVVLGVASVLIAACSADDDPIDSTDPSAGPETSNTAAATSIASDRAASADSGSFANLLAQIPPTVFDEIDTVQLTYGDLDAATEISALDRPDPTDAKATIDWLAELTISHGDRPATVRLTSWNAQQVLQRSDAIRDELGWSLADVGQYLEATEPPVMFTVVRLTDPARLSGGSIDAALRASAGAPTEGIWSLGGEDHSVDLAGNTEARRLGESLRMAARDDLIAVARTTPPIEAWRDTDLGGDDALMSVAQALDEADVYTAVVVAGADHSVVGALGPNASAEQVAAATAQLGDLPAPFDAVGVGVSTDGNGGGIVTIVYRYRTVAAADGSVDAIAAMFGGESMIVPGRVGDRLVLREVTAQGPLVVATVDLADEARLDTVFNILFRRDVPFVHG